MSLHNGTTSGTTSKFRNTVGFFDLPPEIRSQIYGYYFTLPCKVGVGLYWGTRETALITTNLEYVERYEEITDPSKERVPILCLFDSPPTAYRLEDVLKLGLTPSRYQTPTRLLHEVFALRYVCRSIATETKTTFFEINELIFWSYTAMMESFQFWNADERTQDRCRRLKGVICRASREPDRELSAVQEKVFCLDRCRDPEWMEESRWARHRPLLRRHPLIRQPSFAKQRTFGRLIISSLFELWRARPDRDIVLTSYDAYPAGRYRTHFTFSQDPPQGPGWSFCWRQASQDEVYVKMEVFRCEKHTSFAHTLGPLGTTLIRWVNGADTNEYGTGETCKYVEAPGVAPLGRP